MVNGQPLADLHDAAAVGALRNPAWNALVNTAATGFHFATTIASIHSDLDGLPLLTMATIAPIRIWHSLSLATSHRFWTAIALSRNLVL